tara:strand:+ start:1926 stop:2174 length:249 start_codon:yes stop_codon:yes gene_type:complete
MIDEEMWLDYELPLELTFKLERLSRLVEGMEGDELLTVTRACLMHNFHLMHNYKKALRKIEDLENERPNRKTRKAPSKSGKS